MTRLIRDKDPNLFRLITIRTEGARFWMRPSKDVNKIVGGIIARYQELCSIVLYAFSVLSNHYHLVIQAPKENADEFEENVNREIARRLNWKLHRSGNFWGDRYSDQPILTTEDLLEAFLYVTANPVRHGLVDHPSKWPGLSSYRQSITGREEEYPFYHYSADEDDENKVTYHTLKITPLPQFANMPSKERIKEVKQRIEERAKFYVEDRKAKGQGFLGAEMVKAQDPNDVPRESSKSPRPIAYTKDPAEYKSYQARVRERRNEYTESSMRYRLGDYTVEFPSYSFKPPLHRKPRIKPFTPFPDNHFQKAA